MSLSVRVPGTVLESVSVLSGGSADWALVSEQDGACYFAIGRLEGVGRVDGLIFSVIPAEYAHLQRSGVSRACIVCSITCCQHVIISHVYSE